MAVPACRSPSVPVFHVREQLLKNTLGLQRRCLVPGDRGFLRQFHKCCAIRVRQPTGDIQIDIFSSAEAEND
jgi:hypothetical protein